MLINRRFGVPLACLCSMAVVVVAAPQALAQQAQATGEVRRIDAATGKIAIKHDAIKELSLPAMTVVYEAAPALLSDIKPGDKVRFTVTRKDGKYIITALSR
jgi:Cu(I)/Ag(I) efflux system protein CusF